jgi:hypothetical protein
MPAFSPISEPVDKTAARKVRAFFHGNLPLISCGTGSPKDLYESCYGGAADYVVAAASLDVVELLHLAVFDHPADDADPDTEEQITDQHVEDHDALTDPI